MTKESKQSWRQVSTCNINFQGLLNFFLTTYEITEITYKAQTDYFIVLDQILSYIRLAKFVCNIFSIYVQLTLQP